MINNITEVKKITQEIVDIVNESSDDYSARERIESLLSRELEIEDDPQDYEDMLVASDDS